VPPLARVACLAAAALGVAGCGPVEYMNQVGTRAASAVVAAEQAGAAEFAPYELTAAKQYLHQARVEGAYAFYQAAIDFGHKAEDMAGKARVLTAERRVKNERPLRLKLAPAAPGKAAAPDAGPQPTAPMAPPAPAPSAEPPPAGPESGPEAQGK